MSVKGRTGPCCQECLVPDQPLGVCRGVMCDNKYAGYHLLCNNNCVAWCALPTAARDNILGEHVEYHCTRLQMCCDCFWGEGSIMYIPRVHQCNVCGGRWAGDEYTPMECYFCAELVHRACTTLTGLYPMEYACNKCMRKAYPERFPE